MYKEKKSYNTFVGLNWFILFIECFEDINLDDGLGVLWVEDLLHEKLWKDESSYASTSSGSSQLFSPAIKKKDLKTQNKNLCTFIVHRYSKIYHFIIIIF